MTRKIFAALVALVAVGAVLGAWTQAEAQTNLSIGTGSTSGVYHSLGGAIADVVTRNAAGLRVNAEVTRGSVDNVNLVARNPAYFGLASADVVHDAATGSAKFTEKLPIVALAALYPNQVQLVVRGDSGIDSIASLKGKRISTGSAGSGIEVLAFRLIEVAGLDKDRDLTAERLQVNDSVAALKDGKIDGMFFVGGAPAAMITDLAVTPGLSIKLVDLGAMVKPLTDKYGPIYSAGSIPASTYPKMDKDLAVINVWNMLVVNRAMPDDQAYAVAKAIFENKDAIAAAQPTAKEIAVANQTAANSPVPYHPGAARYFAEKGVKAP